jgi:peptidoglycan/xylan/chitin deacetylase (PgdA/CDA1 family)
MTAVIDRDKTDKVPRSSKAKRVWLILVACLSAVALTVSATFAVHFYLDLQAQQHLTVGQSAQLTSLQQALSAQSEQLASQQEQLNAQQTQLTSQASAIASQQSTIEQQKNTIAAQQDTINKQQSTISAQENQIVALTPKEKVKGVASYPDVDITGLRGKKLVALTFDDGPSQYTGKLLDTLKKYNAKATFFVVGSRIGKADSNALLKRMAAEGHVVGNHSQNHKNLKNLTSAQIADEMYAAAERIKTAIGHYPIVMRCPGGNYNATVQAYAKDISVPIIQWSMDTIDWRDRDKATILNRAKNGIKDGSIVLMHDLYSTTVEAACELIPYLQQQGYTLVTVPELLAVKHGTIEPGKVYFHG